MSAHASDPLLRLTSGNSARRKTCLRLSFQLPLTLVQIQAVASRVLAAPESSCATRDAGVPNEVFARGWQADASRKPGPQFCNGIARLKSASRESHSPVRCATTRGFRSNQTRAG